jgi:hypothetical protein
MTRSNLVSMAPFLFAICILFCATPASHAADTAKILSPSAGGTIPAVPGSLAVTGNYSGPAGTITVQISAGQLVNGKWTSVGPVLSSGAGVVNGTLLGNTSPWHANLNSPATKAGVNYVLTATYKDTNGKTVFLSGFTQVISD